MIAVALEVPFRRFQLGRRWNVVDKEFIDELHLLFGEAAAEDVNVCFNIICFKRGVTCDVQFFHD